MGTMSMYYVTNPDGVVANIQTLLDAGKQEAKQAPVTVVVEKQVPSEPAKTSTTQTPRHTLDTREKIRAVIHK